MGLSEYPLKRIGNFKGLSVRLSIGYPCNRLLDNRFKALIDWKYGESR